MYEYAGITGYKPDRDGTHLKIFIPDRHLEEAIVKKRIKDCMIWLDDGRHISAEQRKKAYATIRDIADFTGYAPEEMKERLKLEHIIRTGCKEFSLSDCTMDTAREFINTMLDLALEMGIPLMDFGSNRTDDIDHYLWACLKNRRSGKIQLTSGAVSYKTDQGNGCQYKDMTLHSSVSAAPEIAKALLLYPDEPGGDYGGDYHWVNTTGERLPICGGRWLNASSAGVFVVNLLDPRSYSGSYVGFRSAFCEL